MLFTDNILCWAVCIDIHHMTHVALKGWCSVNIYVLSLTCTGCSTSLMYQIMTCVGHAIFSYNMDDGVDDNDLYLVSGSVNYISKYLSILTNSVCVRMYMCVYVYVCVYVCVCVCGNS